MALSDEARRGRNLVVGWVRKLGLAVTTDQLGIVIGIRAGLESGKPVMTGSHIDTVASGGRYDGNLGVLAGLEVIAALNEAEITTRKPIGVGYLHMMQLKKFDKSKRSLQSVNVDNVLMLQI